MADARPSSPAAARDAPAGCPFHAGAAPPGPVYRRPLGILHQPAVRREIAALDARADCQRIAHLLTAYEFPFDLTRALEVALFHTYGSRSVSRLLDRTGQFQRHGQKRYDDTNLLISHFIEAGWDGDAGARALARMNAIHAHFRIPNDDYLFVLWTFIDFPIEWMDAYGWRPFTAHEREAWFHYWCGIGQRMGITSIPATKADYDTFIAGYEAREMVRDEASTRVADATVAVMAGWLPAPLRPLVKPAAACLVRPQFRRAVGYADPHPAFQAMVVGALKLRRAVKRWFSIERHPFLVAHKRMRTYPAGLPQIETVGPAGLPEQRGHRVDGSRP